MTRPNSQLTAVIMELDDDGGAVDTDAGGYSVAAGGSISVAAVTCGGCRAIPECVSHDTASKGDSAAENGRPHLARRGGNLRCTDCPAPILLCN